MLKKTSIPMHAGPAYSISSVTMSLYYDELYIGSLRLTAQFNTTGEPIMLDRTAKLKTYQTYIDGRWIDAASGTIGEL